VRIRKPPVAVSTATLLPLSPTESSFTDGLIDGSVDGLIDGLIGCSIDGLIGCSIDGLIDGSVGAGQSMPRSCNQRTV
jgi:hypothetical protein